MGNKRKLDRVKDIDKEIKNLLDEIEKNKSLINQDKFKVELENFNLEFKFNENKIKFKNEKYWEGEIEIEEELGSKMNLKNPLLLMLILSERLTTVNEYEKKLLRIRTLKNLNKFINEK